MQYTITHDDSLEIGITAARLAYNKALPATITQTNADGTVSEVPNPNLLAANSDYVEMIHSKAAQSWYDSMQYAFRLPSGDWLQRFTAAEKQGLRDIAAGKYPAVAAADVTKLQGFLTELDASPIINLSFADVVNGVPYAFGLLETAGVLAAGQGAVRAAAINAVNV